MSVFTQYKDLEDAVVEWVDREDIRPYVGQYARLVTVEATRDLRVPIMERTLVIPVTADASAKAPVDLIEIKNVNWVLVDEDGDDLYITDRIALNRTSQFEYQKTRKEGSYVADSKPTAFAQEGAFIKIAPLPIVDELIIDEGSTNDTVAGYIEMTYYALPITMKTPFDRNWLLDTAPDIYFYGCLMHACRFIKDLDSSEFWAGKYKESLAALQGQAKKAEYSGGPIIVGG